MIFSRIALSVCRSTRSTFRKNVVTGNYNARTELPNESILPSMPLGNAFVSRVDSGLNLAKGYFASAGAGKQLVLDTYVSNMNSIFANPRLRRFFSSEAPKRRKYRNYYPTNKKEIPKANQQKTESKEDSGAGDHRNFQNFIKQFLSMISPLFFIGFVLSSMLFKAQQQNEISFQEFKNKLLERGLVDKIVVSNRSVAKVYVKDTPQNAHETEDDSKLVPVNANSARRNLSQYKFYFNIGSVESFEEKLEEAQRALGIDPHDYIPVTYASKVNWFQVLMRFAPTALLLGFLWFTGRRIQRGIGVGGPGGRGGRGIFNIGKATITKMDKNSKDKVFFKDVAGCDEAKQEIMEFVHFLKNPKKYEELGAKIPKGALLVGPPGTGKTLLAKATAGESGVPFLSMSGSDFIEMFVGVGPSRVRSLFQEARQCAPSIIFIDEIDAIGRARGRGGFSGGNDERESRLKMTVSADDEVPSGFRFDPTDEELVLCYLKRKICNQKIKPDIIAETNVYKSDPEELPGQSLLKAGNKQWFFFSPRDGKYPNGASSNRATRLGYWKATGKDRIITYSSLNIGVKKILVFSRGRAPNGERTDWMMHEYTLHEEELKRCQNVQDCYALCKVFKKSGPGPKNGEQYGAPSREEDWVDDEVDVTKTVDTDSPAMQLNGGIDPAGGGRANDQVPYALYNLEEIMRQSADDAESQINCGYELPKVFGQEEAQSSTLLKRASREVIFPKQDRVCDELAGVDFTQLSPSNLQLFEAPEVTSAPPQDYEQVLQLCQEGFLEMNDLISPESTFSAVENPVENLQFDELDGMSLFDLNDDAAMFPNGMGPIYQDMNVPGNDVLNQVDHQFQPHSLENQVDQQLQQNIVVNQVQLQPATSGTDLISTQPWMQQQQSNLFTPAESNQGILCQTTSGTVEEVTQPLAEASENQNGQEGGGDTTSWLSSFIWAYVESIPTSSASASEIPLMNPAFEQVSGFSRIRANARNTNVAGCNRPVTRRQGGGIGFLILSILGILCAILWMLMGTVRVLGRCKFSS